MKFVNLIFLVLLAIVTCKVKFSTKPCTALGLDCDSSKICCGDYHCVNDRCQFTKEKSTMEYRKTLGGRCNPFHLCGKGLTCQSHRCTLKGK